MVSTDEERNVKVDANDDDVLLIELFAAAMLSDTVDSPVLIELAKDEETVSMVE